MGMATESSRAVCIVSLGSNAVFKSPLSLAAACTPSINETMNGLHLALAATIAADEVDGDDGETADDEQREERLEQPRDRAPQLQ